MGNYVSTKDTKDNRYSVGFRKQVAETLERYLEYKDGTMSALIADQVLWALRNRPEVAEDFRRLGLTL